MTRRRFLTGLAATGIFLIASACGEEASGIKRYPDYRYRLTVEVDTPEGLKTGSSVVEVSTAKSGASSIPSPNTISTRVRGEAVAVDLGKRGTLFALLRSEESVDWAAGPLFLIVPNVPYKDIENILENENRDPSFDIRMNKLYKLKGPYELPRHYYNAQHKLRPSDPPTAYPMMVTFKDMANPKSVTKIDADNLAATFGNGVKLKRITVEMTEDSVTTGIEKRLVWLPSQRGSIVKYPRQTPISEIPPIHRLNEGDFTLGVIQ